MKKYCVEFAYEQLSRGTATIEAKSLKDAQEIANEMTADDSRIDFNPVDGTLDVMDIDEVTP